MTEPKGAYPSQASEISTETEEHSAPLCAAETFPVWSDGSQEYFRCEEPAGHRGPHISDGGDWSWNS